MEMFRRSGEFGGPAGGGDAFAEGLIGLAAAACDSDVGVAEAEAEAESEAEEGPLLRLPERRRALPLRRTSLAPPPPPLRRAVVGLRGATRADGGAEGDEESETDASVSDRLVASASEPLGVIAP